MHINYLNDPMKEFTREMTRKPPLKSNIYLSITQQSTVNVNITFKHQNYSRSGMGPSSESSSSSKSSNDGLSPPPPKPPICLIISSKSPPPIPPTPSSPESSSSFHLLKSHFSQWCFLLSEHKCGQYDSFWFAFERTISMQRSRLKLLLFSGSISLYRGIVTSYSFFSTPPNPLKYTESLLNLSNKQILLDFAVKITIGNLLT